MISYRFEIADEDEALQILVQDSMVDIANEFEINLIISFNLQKEKKTKRSKEKQRKTKINENK